GTSGPELLIRPPETTLFHQLLAYLQAKPDSPKRPSGPRPARRARAALATRRWRATTSRCRLRSRSGSSAGGGAGTDDLRERTTGARDDGLSAARQAMARAGAAVRACRDVPGHTVEVDAHRVLA